MSTSTPPTYDYAYTGDAPYQPPVKGDQDPQGRWYYPYLPGDELKEAVNVAIALERPLLLEGEPGCGKTRLAGAIAYEYTQKNLQGQQDAKGNHLWWDYYIWNVKSTTQAQDGLYTYDAIARLRDAQLVGAERLQEYLQPQEFTQLAERLRNRRKYLTLGAFGKALIPKEQRRAIVLIDEIDKADSDFPNDLLLELEEQRFEIPEVGKQVPPPKQKPIVIITSNREKPLPEPFLRRCLYFFVEFPQEDRLREILDRRFGQQAQLRSAIVDAAIEFFYQVREFLERQPGSRPPGTSEFLEFLQVLLQQPTPDDALKKLAAIATPKERALLGTLIKTHPDQKAFCAFKGQS